MEALIAYCWTLGESATRRQAFEAAAVCCLSGVRTPMTEAQLAKLVESLEARVYEAGQGVQACQSAPNRAARYALERRLMELSDTYAHIFSLFARQIAGVTKTAREIVAHVDYEVELAARALEDLDSPVASELPVTPELPVTSELPVAPSRPARRTAVRPLRAA